MKALVAVLLLLAVFTVLLPGSVSAQSNCTTSICSATVDSTISTNVWGITVVTEKVILTIASPVSHVGLGIPSSLSSQLRTAIATDTQNALLGVSNLGTQTTPSGTGYTALDVVFPSTQSGPYTFNLTTVYSGLLTYSPTASSFSLNVNPFPVTDGTFNVTRAGVTLKTGDWPSPKISPINQTVLSGTFTAQAAPLNAFNTTVWKISFNTAGTTQNIFDVSAGRLIVISPSGSVQVTDSYNMTNRGPTLSSVAFTLPKGVSGVSASDVIGHVTTTAPTANSDGTSTLTFTPRFSSSQIPYNGSIRVQISYQLSPQVYLSSGSLGRFTLNFEAFDSVRFYEPTLQTKIVTPMGFRLNTFTGQVPQTSGNQVLIQVSPLTPMSNLGFSMSYQLDPFWASLSPLGWAGLLEAALMASALALWSRPGATVAVAGAPSQLINRFVELYDEKSSMRLEADKMEEDLNRGAMNKYDYKRRRRVIDLRMAEIDRALALIKEQLSSVQNRYQDMIKRIERAEAELQVVKNTSGDLRNQYRGGKIAKDLYESLIADLIRRRERAEQTIDTIVINLREEVR